MRAKSMTREYALPPPLTETLRARYDEKHAACGVRYFVRRSGKRPVLLVNAYITDDVGDSTFIPVSAYTDALDQIG